MGPKPQYNDEYHEVHPEKMCEYQRNRKRERLNKKRKVT